MSCFTVPMPCWKSIHQSTSMIRDPISDSLHTRPFFFFLNNWAWKDLVVPIIAILCAWTISVLALLQLRAGSPSLVVLAMIIICLSHSILHTCLGSLQVWQSWDSIAIPLDTYTSIQHRSDQQNTTCCLLYYVAMLIFTNEVVSCAQDTLSKFVPWLGTNKMLTDT